MTAKYISDVKKIENSADKIYAYLSDFEKLSKLFEQAIENEHSQLNDIKDKFRIVDISSDRCIVNIKDYGDIEVKIIHKEPYNTIKFFGGENSSFPFLFWIQLVEKALDDTRMRLTLHAEINYFIRKMVNKKLKKGINQLADALVKIPY